MPNNERFFQAAREALTGDYADCSISGLVIDLNMAVNEYLKERLEDGTLNGNEIHEGLIHVQPFVRDLRGWNDLAAKEVNEHEELSALRG